MILSCPHCQARCRVKTPDSLSPETRGRCPKCGSGFLISEAKQQTPKISQGPSVLIVDDSPFFQEMIREVLQGLHCHCLFADSVAAAWEMLEKTSVELMIVDINMPGVSGVDLIQQVRRHSELKNIPILAISSVYRRDQDQTLVLRAGADEFISKSFRPEEFQQRVKHLLGQRGGTS